MAESIKRRIDGQFFRVIRERPPIVKSVIDTYLFQRNYPEDRFHKRSISLEELASDENLMGKVRRPNSILFNNSTFRNIFSNDTSNLDIESAFSKLHQWISTIVCDKIKNELLHIVSPLFCHMFLDLMQGGFQQSASALLKYYQEQTDIPECDVVTQVIKDLNCLDYKSRPVIKSFRANKYVMTITLDAINVLKYFLANHGHLLVIQVLQNWFDFELILLEQCIDMDEPDEEIPTICNGNAPKQEMDLDLSDLQDAIDAVNKQTPPLLNINVYNSQDKATCGQVSFLSRKVVAGFSNSEIWMWGLGNAPLLNGPINNEAAKIQLACEPTPEDAVNPFDNGPLTPSGALIMRGHSDSVQDVSFVKDNFLLSVSQDCTMRAWNLDDYACTAIYRGHNLPIWCVDVSTLDVYIATGSQDSTVRVWTFDRIYPVRVCVGHTKDVNSVKFHPNGSYVGSGSADTIVRMFSINEEAKCVRMLIGHTGPVYSIAFSSNGMYLASAGADKTIKIWDIISSKELVELTGPQHIITDLTWSADSKYLAVASLDGKVAVWDANLAVKQGQQNLPPTTVYNTGRTSLLAVDYDKKWLTCLSASYMM